MCWPQKRENNRRTHNSYVRTIRYNEKFLLLSSAVRLLMTGLPHNRIKVHRWLNSCVKIIVGVYSTWGHLSQCHQMIFIYTGEMFFFLFFGLMAVFKQQGTTTTFALSSTSLSQFPLHVNEAKMIMNRLNTQIVWN